MNTYILNNIFFNQFIKTNTNTKIMKLKSTFTICFAVLFFFSFNSTYANFNTAISNISTNEIDISIQTATAQGRVIDISSGGYSIAQAISSVAILPVIFRSKIDGWNYDIVVFEMNFEKDQAYLKVGCKFSIPENQNSESIYFGADRIAFSSKNGFKGELKILPNTLSSAHNHEISPEANSLLNGKSSFYEITLPGFGNSLKMGLDEDTKLSFSCGAFEKFELSGYIKSFNSVDQENAQGQTINAGLPYILAFSSVSVTDWQDIFFQAKATNAFHSKSYADLGFSFENPNSVLVDLSKRQKPNNLPKCTNLSGDFWKGIYFESFDIRLPKFFKLKSGASLPSYKGKNLFIDPSGLVGNMVADKVFSLEEGTTNGLNPMDMSLEKITIDYSCGGNINGLFIGQIGFNLCDNSGEKFRNDYVFSYTEKAGYLYSLKETNSNNLKSTNTITFSNGSSLSLKIQNGNLDVLEKYHSIPSISSDLFNNSLCKNYTGNLSVKSCPDNIEWSSGGTTPTLKITPVATTTYTVNCYDKYCINAISEPIEIVVYDRLEAPLLSSDKGEAPFCASSYVNVSTSGSCPGIIEWQKNTEEWVSLPSNATALTLYEPQIATNTTFTYRTRCRLNTCIGEASNLVTLNLLKSPLKPNVVSSPSDNVVCLKKWLGAENCQAGNYRWYKDDILIENTSGQLEVTQEGSYKYNVNCVDSSTGCESGYYGDIYFTIDRCHCAPEPTMEVQFSHQSRAIRENESFTFYAQACSNGGTIHWYNAMGEIGTGTQLTLSEKAGDFNYSMKCINSYGCESKVTYTQLIKVKEICDSDFKPAKPVYNQAIPSNETNDVSISIYMSCPSNATLFWYNFGKEEVGTGSTYTITNTLENLNKDIYLYTRCKNCDNCYSEFKLDQFRINKDGGPLPCENVSVPTISANKTQIQPNETATLTANSCAGTVKWSNGSEGLTIEVGLGTYTAKCKIGDCESVSSNGVQIQSVNCDKTLAPRLLSGLSYIDALNHKQISLSWDYQECTPEGLRIEGSDDNINWYFIGLINGTIKSIRGIERVNNNYFDSEEQFWFRVKSYNGGNLSGPSEVISITILSETIPCLPPPAPVISSNPTIICGTQLSTLTASGCNGTIIWSTSSTQTTIQAGIGTYTATCKSSCGTSSTSNSITITTGSTTAPVISSDRKTVCKNEKATLTASGCECGTIFWGGGLGAGRTKTVGAASFAYTAICVTALGETAKSNPILITKQCKD
jgi:hypothetical protein